MRSWGGAGEEDCSRGKTMKVYLAGHTIRINPRPGSQYWRGAIATVEGYQGLNVSAQWKMRFDSGGTGISSVAVELIL